MTMPGYLKIALEALQESKDRDISDLSDKSPPGQSERQPQRHLWSLTSLMSHSPPSAESFAEAFDSLERRCPAYVDQFRWQQCVDDGRRFLSQWGERAQALGWSPEELFGLHEVPASPHPSFDRLARYDCLGLIWLLQSKLVVALTIDSASIRQPSGTVTRRRRGDHAGKTLRWMRQGAACIFFLLFVGVGSCWADSGGAAPTYWFSIFLITIDIAILLGLSVTLILGVALLIELKRILPDFADKKKER